MAAALTLPLAAQTGGGTLDAAFASLDKTSQQFHTLTADIARTVHTAIVNADEQDSGTIKVKLDKGRETRMLIDFTKPDPRTVSIDSKEATLYYPKIKTAQAYNIAGKKALVEEFLLLGFGASSTALKESYDVTLAGTEKVGAENTWHLQLVPKSKEVLQRLKKAELWIDSSGLPAQQRFVTSAAGDFTLVTYSNAKLNPPVSDSALKLNLPKGVKVEHPQL
jgi:outer membrane lipoprotein-sorting protein